jgi:hypothetical protein
MQAEAMDKTEQLKRKTKDLLHQIDTLQAAIKQLHAELREHREEIALLRKKPPTKESAPLKKAPAEEPAPAPAKERRASPRRKGNPVSVQIHHGDLEYTIEGWVLDRSPGGLRLLVDECIAPGTLLNVRPAKDEHLPWVEVKVRNSRPERKSWNIGCEFVEKITWEKLRYFG